MVVLAPSIVVPWAETPAAADPVRVMPLGDSNTRGLAAHPWENRVAYRRALYGNLQHQGITADFVGSQVDGTGFDSDHEGYGGMHASAGSVPAPSPGLQANVYQWVAAAMPDVALMHIGTNDIEAGESASSVANQVDSVLNEIDRYERDSGRAVTVILARIINRQNTTDAKGAETTALNQRLQSLGDSRRAVGDRIRVVDMESALSYPADMADTLHPTTTGYAKMADTWLSAIMSVLTGGSTTSSTMTTTPTTTTTAPGTMAGLVRVSEAADRQNSRVLDGTNIDSETYVFVDDPRVTSVTFTLNGSEARSEGWAPFDFEQSGDWATPLRPLSLGSHRIGAHLSLTTGSTVYAESVFTRTDGTTATTTTTTTTTTTAPTTTTTAPRSIVDLIRVSETSDRRNSRALDGTAVDSETYVFVDDPSISGVLFAIDGVDARSEGWAPFDFEQSGDSATPLRPLSLGSHRIGAYLSQANGSTVYAESAFTRVAAT